MDRRPAGRCGFETIIALGLLSVLGCGGKPRGDGRGAGGTPGEADTLALPEGWTPEYLEPAAWYFASSTDYQVANNVATWTNRRGGGRNLTQVVSWAPQLLPSQWDPNKPTLRFNAATMLATDPWSGPPIGTNTGFTVLAVIRSTLPQNAGIAAWWSEWGDGVWANLRSTGGPTPLTLLDYHRLDDGTLTQMYAGNQDLGTGGHVVAWRFSPSTQTATLMVDGALAQSTHQPLVGNITSMPLYVGAMSPLPTGLFQGDISELVIVGDEISDLEMQYFNEYARETWNLSPSPGGGPCIKADGQPSPDTIRCDDGNPETFGDHCSAGGCVGNVPGPGSPKDLSPIAWYHAGASEVVITWDGVSTWFDRSSEHHDLLNGYWGRPDLVSDGWSPNKPTVRFDGANALKRNGWTGTPTGSESAFTVLAVLQRCSDTPACSQTSGIVSWWNPNGYGQIAARLKASGAASALNLRRLDHILATQDPVGSIDVGAGRHVVAWRYQNGVTKLTVDGLTQTQTGSPIGPIPADWFLMGVASGHPTDLFRGDISELAVIPRSISDTELASFNNYAQAEWGGLTLCTYCGLVRPTVTCVANDNGTLYAMFGYENATSAPVQIPVGPGNQISVPIAGRAPIVFQPGLHDGVFPAKLVNGSATWTLGGMTAQATASSLACPPLPPGETEENDDATKIVPPAPGTPGVASVTYVEASSNAAPLVQVPADPNGPPMMFQPQDMSADQNEEETQALIHGDRGSRAVEVVLVNNTDVTITFGDGMARGAISTQPPSFIAPGSYGTFETRNANIAQGTEGWLVYGIQTGGPTPLPAFTLFWSNPLIGSNDYGHAFHNNAGFVIDRVGGENALATVFFILRRSSTPQTNCARGSMQWIIDNLKKVEPRLTAVEIEPARFFTPVKRSGLGIQAWGQTGCLATEVIGRVARPTALSTDSFFTIDVFLDQFEGAVLRGTDKAIRIEVDPVEPRFGVGENPAHNAIMDGGGAGLLQVGTRIRFSGVVRIDHGHFLEVHPSAPIEAAVSCDSPNPPAHCNPVFGNIFTATVPGFEAEAVVNMGRAKDRACFPITIDGVFASGAGGLAKSAVTARIDDATGDWQLVVRSGASFGGMRGQARCVAATGLTDEFVWVGGGNSITLPSISGTRSCYLTSIEGDWSSSESFVNIDDFRNPPRLEGSGNGRARARCMDVGNAEQFGFHIINPEPFPPKTMEPVEFGCYYNQVRGAFWSPPFGSSGGSLTMGFQTVGTELHWTGRGRGTTGGGTIRCDRLSQ
jgi:hypothetical protein